MTFLIAGVLKQKNARNRKEVQNEKKAVCCGSYVDC